LLQTCRSAEEAYAVVAQYARKMIAGASGALYVLKPSHNYVELCVLWGDNRAAVQSFAPADCLALRRGQPYFVAAATGGLVCAHVGARTAPYLCIPMMAQGESLGVLHLCWPPADAAAGPDPNGADMSLQRRLALTLAENFALALANLNLREALRNQAIRDSLTGLFNRRYMEETLAREVSRAERRKQTLGVIMLDLDHFKQYNDTFGHTAGDMVLREIGAFLQSHSRTEDIACRFGGEEFVVILPEATLDETLHRAELFRASIKSLNLLFDGRPLDAVSVSLGAASYPQNGATAESLIRAVDKALYAAKRQGRDRVAAAEAAL
jgi:diguanylate cyclase (GGDEF)-like protein